MTQTHYHHTNGNGDPDAPNGHSNGYLDTSNSHSNGYSEIPNGHSNGYSETSNGHSNGYSETSNGHINGNGSHNHVLAEEKTLPPVAVVGMAMRLPGNVKDETSFWDLLINQKDGRCKVPQSRYNVNGFHTSGKKEPGTVASEYGYFLTDDLSTFDAAFFSMSKAEVEQLDPQQRLLLEVVWEAMESAGQTNWRGTDIGVYVGSFGEDWLDLIAKEPQAAGVFRIPGAGDFDLSNRISYEYNLKGPSMTIRTACSSSMICLNEACQALYNGLCKSAIVSGTNIILSPTMTIAMHEQGALSLDGICKSFDANANGYARGEGVNAVYLKLLSDAIRDGDPIRGVIRGTSANSDGKTPGITMPSIDAHEALIRKAYELANIRDVTETGFVELHATGTVVGDPIETGAVARVFGSEKGIIVGGAKPNFGHSEGASGLTSFMKVLLALEKQTIPPNMHFKTPNPKIPWKAANMRVPVVPTPWPHHKVERASVNSFGIGGSNAHVIVESARAHGINNTASTANGYHPDAMERARLLVFSAQNADSLARITKDNEAYIKANPELVHDIAYTLGMRREHMAQRSFGIFNREKELELFPATRVKKSPKLAFVYTGQGAQWAEMGRELYRDFPSFRADIASLNKTLSQLPDPPSWTIEDELLKPRATSRIDESEFAQPLQTALQICITNLLNSWNIYPDAIVGHSSGEVAAAYGAGAITAGECIIAAYYRGLGTKVASEKGAMAAVGLGRAEVTPFLTEGAMIGCENSQQSVTLSGAEEPIMHVIERIRREKPEVFVRKLKVAMAYHSHLMRGLGAAYQNALDDKIVGKAPRVPFFSSLSGELVTEAGVLGPSYWRSNSESPVLFLDAVKLLVKTVADDILFIEVGPHLQLKGPLRQIFQVAEKKGDLSYVPCLERFKDCTDSLLSLAGQLWQRDIPVNLAKINLGGRVVTDLPRYSWQHNASYWHESRITREWRLREFPRHETLGSRILEGNDFEPTWRNNLSLSESPWIRDHKVKDDIVFPFAGYAAIIGAAISQLKGTADFTLRRITVQAALVMRESESVEVITTLRPLRLTNSLDSSWFEFTVSSYNGSDAWTKHCSGQVRGGTEFPVPARTVEKFPRTVASPYDVLKSVGLNYGPTFQGLQDVSTAPGKKTASGTVIQDPQFQKGYALHPSVIDCCLQLCLSAMSEGNSRLLTSLCVPTEIGELYIAPGMSSNGLKVQATMEGISSKDAPGSVFAVSDDGNTVLSLKGLRVSPLDNEDEIEKPGATELVFRPDVDFLKIEELIPPTEDAQRKDALTQVEKLCTLCILELHSQSKEPIQSLSYLSKFNDWLRLQTEMVECGKQSVFSDIQSWAALSSAERLSMIDIVHSEALKTSVGPAAVLIKRVFDNYNDIMEGKSEPLEVLLPDDGLTKFYNAIDEFTDYTGFAAALGHENPTLRILEIGAGTGGTSYPIISQLSLPDGSRMYSKYTYTDISAGFFINAKERFKDFGGIEFKTLDISQDPISQGFEPRGYDLIVAANVLHATESLFDTLTNVRKLLAPKGRVYLQELHPVMQLSNFIMGILPGWWLGEKDNRKIQPYISPERWDVEFKKAGFAGVEAFVYDGPYPFHINANIVARPLDERFIPKNLSIICDENSASIATSLQAQLEKSGWEVSRCSIFDSPKPDAKMISVLDLGGPFFEIMQTKDFVAFQQFLSVLNNNTCLLWLMPAAQVNCIEPRTALTLGAARSIRSELSLNFTTLELDKVDAEAFGFVPKVLEKACYVPEAGILNPDYEFVLSDGVINVGRYHKINVPSQLPIPVTEERSKKLRIGRFGLLQTLAWQSEDIFPPLHPEDLEIEPVCVGVNFRDVLSSMGIIEIATKGLGCESSGIVRKVGSAVTDFKVGDRIMTFEGGMFASRNQVPALRCTKIPDSLSFEDAATMPAVYATVIHSLLNLCNLQRGQTVLIHSASGGVGIAAIQICAMIGAEVYLTAGHEDKVRFLQETFGIPRERIFYSRDTSFLLDVMKATNNRGVDVVLNSLSGELLHASWQCVAEFGKFVELGKRDFNGHGRLEMDIFEANRSFFGVDLNAFKPAQCRPLLDETVELYAAGLIQPIKPQKFYDASEVEDAFRYMQKGVHIGKVVVKIPQVWDNMDLKEGQKFIEFRKDASYLLIGGLGGLGKAISNWMVERGARSFVYLSRSAESADNEAFVKELESQGASVTLVSGSVANFDDVKKAVAASPTRIAGVLQMSLVLRDNNFLDLTFDEWQGAVEPKVQGTWNVHEALGSSDLDFFVLFGSLSGSTGFPGQANYAAGNTFLDAFVQYRHQQGLAASVLDIGVVGEIGYVAQNEEIRDNLRRIFEAYEIQEADLIESLQYSMWRGHPKKNYAKNQSTSYTSEAQLAIGLKSIKPLSDPDNRLNWRRDRRVGVMYNLTTASTTTNSSDDELKAFLAAAEGNPSLLDTDEGLDQLSRTIGIRIYTFMMQNLEDLDTAQTLVALGVDSLVTIEIRNWWRRAFMTEVSTLELLDAKTIAGLGKLAATGLKKKFEQKAK